MPLIVKVILTEILGLFVGLMCMILAFNNSTIFYLFAKVLMPLIALALLGTLLTAVWTVR